ncbi:unnamed protein product [Staurois parvus]|uniref:Uncharacterized protein n=1 Tax=Staurois parvus TaxID=386267 RepID=A0ABN9GD49_9NEOB|nr:unnamed protein product [Staurois parvus]
MEACGGIGRELWRTLIGEAVEGLAERGGGHCLERPWRDWQRGVEDTEWRPVGDWQRGVEDTEWRPVEGLAERGGGH